MIIVKILGGLGNQLFQYRFYRYLIGQGLEVKVDLTEFDHYELHNSLEIDEYFNIEWDIASIDEIEKLKDYKSDLISKFRRIILKTGIKSHVKESDFELDNLPVDCYLDGYWQDNKFFCLESDILNNLTFKNLDLNQRNKEVLALIKSEESVGIHFRLGDFLLKKNKKKYYSCTDIYYKKALEYINNIKPNIKIFIFSDDINYVERNFDFGNAVYIDHNKGKDSFFDLYLMSHCKNLIIANSTFSWWGARLNKLNRKIIIAPQYWKKDINNIYLPNNWKLIDNRV